MEQCCPELTFRIPAFFYVKLCHLPAHPGLGSASALTTGVFIVDAACWATQGSRGGCPSSHVPHSRRMFLTLSNGMTPPGLGLSDWNATEKESPGVIQILTSPQPLLVFFFFIPFLIFQWPTQPSTLTNPQPWLVLISATSQQIGMQIRIFCWVMCPLRLFPKHCLRPVIGSSQDSAGWHRMSRKSSVHFSKKCAVTLSICLVVISCSWESWTPGGSRGTTGCADKFEKYDYWPFPPTLVS